MGNQLDIFSREPLAQMNRTWIGYRRPITIGPIVKPSTHLISPQCDITGRQRPMMAIVFVCIIEEVAPAHLQNTPCGWFLSTPGLGVVPRLLSKMCWFHVVTTAVPGYSAKTESGQSWSTCSMRILIAYVGKRLGRESNRKNISVNLHISFLHYS